MCWKESKKQSNFSEMEFGNFPTLCAQALIEGFLTPFCQATLSTKQTQKCSRLNAGLRRALRCLVASPGKHTWGGHPLLGCSAGLVNTVSFPHGLFTWSSLAASFVAAKWQLSDCSWLYNCICSCVSACSWMQLTGQSLQMNHRCFGSSGSVSWRRDLTLLFSFTSCELHIAGNQQLKTLLNTCESLLGLRNHLCCMQWQKRSFLSFLTEEKSPTFLERHTSCW